MTKWIHVWMKKCWKLSKVVNREDFKALIQASRSLLSVPPLYLKIKWMSQIRASIGVREIDKRIGLYDEKIGALHEKMARLEKEKEKALAEKERELEMLKQELETGTAGMSNSRRSATVYTDGACGNNGFGDANAGIGVFWGRDDSRNVSEPLPGRQTNNRAEIHAVVRAAEQAQSSGYEELNVHTDSQFLINSMTKWMDGWKKKDWKLSNGGPVVNREDFEALTHASRGLKINYTHVRGHQGIYGNECADHLATEGAKKRL